MFELLGIPSHVIDLSNKNAPALRKAHWHERVLYLLPRSELFFVSKRGLSRLESVVEKFLSQFEENNRNKQAKELSDKVRSITQDSTFLAEIKSKATEVANKILPLPPQPAPHIEPQVQSESHLPDVPLMTPPASVPQSQMAGFIEQLKKCFPEQATSIDRAAQGVSQAPGQKLQLANINRILQPVIDKMLSKPNFTIDIPLLLMTLQETFSASDIQPILQQVAELIPIPPDWQFALQRFAAFLKGLFPANFEVCIQPFITRIARRITQNSLATRDVTDLFRILRYTHSPSEINGAVKTLLESIADSSNPWRELPILLNFLKENLSNFLNLSELGEIPQPILARLSSNASYESVKLWRELFNTPLVTPEIEVGLKSPIVRSTFQELQSRCRFNDIQGQKECIRQLRGLFPFEDKARALGTVPEPLIALATMLAEKQPLAPEPSLIDYNIFKNLYTGAAEAYIKKLLERLSKEFPSYTPEQKKAWLTELSRAVSDADYPELSGPIAEFIKTNPAL